MSVGLDRPAAWTAMALTVVFVLLAVFRRRPRVVDVASLILWAKIPGRLPPVRELRGPRLSWVFWLQAICLAALTAALSAPFRDRPATARPVAYVFDNRPTLRTRMRDGRTRWEHLRVEAAIPDPLEADPDAAAEVLRARAAAPAGAALVWVSDRPAPEGWTPDGEIRVADDASNVGIVSARVTEGIVSAVVLNPGPPIEVAVNGVRRTLPTGRTIVTAPLRGERAELALDVEDAYEVDDSVAFRREGRPARVALRGEWSRSIARALAAVGAEVVPEDRADLVVDEAAPASGGWPPERIDLADDPLLRDVAAEEVGAALAWEVGGRALLRADGRTVVGIDGRTLRVGLAVDGSGWAASPSFPIFWKNVTEYATRESGGGERWIRTAPPDLGTHLTDARGTTVRRPPDTTPSAPERAALGGPCAGLAMAAALLLAWASARGL